jgi:hypothetical protein
MITDVDATKKSTVCRLYMSRILGRQQINVFTAIIQDFWLACQSIDTAEATNYNELAPW